jgi:hypothetical protein
MGSAAVLNVSFKKKKMRRTFELKRAVRDDGAPYDRTVFDNGAPDAEVTEHYSSSH